MFFTLKEKQFIPLVFLILFLGTLLNSIHNEAVANETRNRDINYETWKVISKDKGFFSDVKSGDAFISSTQDDAYETNRGSFFYLSGIRLSAMFQPRFLWPELEKCKDPQNCNLPTSRDRMLERIHNLVRTNNEKSVGNGKMRLDWVDQVIQNGTLEKSQLWIFEIFPITPTTVVAYLIPITNSNGVDEADIEKAKLSILTLDEKFAYGPALLDICFQKSGGITKVDTRIGTIYQSKWRFPSVLISPVGEKIALKGNPKIFGIKAGVCYLGKT